MRSRSGRAGRWQQRGRGAGAVPRGCPRGTGGAEGSGASPLSAALAPPSSPPGPCSRAPAEGTGDRGQGLPLVPPSRGDAHGWSPDTDTGGSWAPASSRSSSTAGNSRLRWRRALPEMLVRDGAVNSIFLSVKSLPGPVSPPPSLLIFFRCSRIVRSPTPLPHPGGTQGASESSAGGTLTLTRVWPRVAPTGPSPGLRWHRSERCPAFLALSLLCRT